MKNITVSVDDETYRKACVRAVELDTSVSALVRNCLQEIAAGESERERLKRKERELRDQVKGFSAADRLSREHLHDR